MNEQRAQEDLAMIRRLMEDSRREIVDRGRHFLVWGVIGALGSLLTYGHAVQWSSFSPGWLWLGLMALGWTASTLIALRETRAARVQTAARRLLSVVSIASAVTITLVALAGMFGGLVAVETLPGLLSVVIGVPVLVAGALAGEGWLQLVGVGWWVGGGIMLFAGGLYSLLLMSAMSLVLMAVPGGVLYAKSRGTRPPPEPITETP